MLLIRPDIVHEVFPSNEYHLQILILAAKFRGITHARQCMIHPPPKCPKYKYFIPRIIYWFLYCLFKVICILFANLLNLNSFLHIIIFNIAFYAVKVSHDATNFICVLKGSMKEFISSSIRNNYILTAL